MCEIIIKLFLLSALLLTLQKTAAENVNASSSKHIKDYGTGTPNGKETTSLRSQDTLKTPDKKLLTSYELNDEKDAELANMKFMYYMVHAINKYNEKTIKELDLDLTSCRNKQFAANDEKMKIAELEAKNKEQLETVAQLQMELEKANQTIEVKNLSEEYLRVENKSFRIKYLKMEEENKMLLSHHQETDKEKDNQIRQLALTLSSEKLKIAELEATNKEQGETIAQLYLEMDKVNHKTGTLLKKQRIEDHNNINLIEGLIFFHRLYNDKTLQKRLDWADVNLYKKTCEEQNTKRQKLSSRYGNDCDALKSAFDKCVDSKSWVDYYFEMLF